MLHLRILPLLIGLVSLQSPAHLEALELIRDGKPSAEIIISPDAPPQVRFAAREFQEHLEKMSGGRLPIVETPSPDAPFPVYIGESESTRKLGYNAQKLPREGYHVIASPRHLVLLGHDATVLPIPRGHTSTEVRPALLEAWQKLAGEPWDYPRNGLYDPRFFNKELGFSFYDPTGTLFAVYDLLEQFGVRWYLPYHQDGTIIPEKPSITVTEQDQTREPVFSYRFMRWSFASRDLDGFLWAKRQKLGIGELIWFDHGTSSITRQMSGRDSEYFAVVGGERRNSSRVEGKNKKGSGHIPRLAPPLAEALVRYADLFFREFPEMNLIPAGPSDAFTSIDDRDAAAGWLREERGSKGRLSDYVWTFVNQVAGGIRKNHPDKLVLGLAYSFYREPPLDIATFEPNLALGYCQTRRLEMLTPEQQDAFAREREAWLGKLPSKVLYIWEYNLTQLKEQLRGVPVFIPGIIQKDLQALAGKSRGEYVECAWSGKGQMLNPGINHLAYYLQARLYWNPDEDQEAIIDAYCRDFFGPAAETMNTFYRFAEEVWTRPASRQITLTGGFLRPADVERFFSLLETAKAQSGGGAAQRRIELMISECAPMKEIFPALARTGPTFAIGKAPHAGTTRPPVDGDLTKPLWAGVEPYRMVNNRTGEPLEPETTVAMRWASDGSGLYLAITAMEPEMDKVRPQASAAVRDSFTIYDSDFIEIFLETATRSTFGFVINPNGAIYDSCSDAAVTDKPLSWTAHWETSVRKKEDRWIVELFIPLASLDDATLPTRDAPWGINVCRSRFATGVGQNSALAPTGGRFSETGKFGNLILEQ